MYSFRSRAQRGLLAAGSVLVLAGSAVGVVSAQQPPPTGTPSSQTQPTRPGPQAFLDTLAGKLGITSDRLQQAMTETRTELGLPERRQGFGPGGHHGGRGGMERHGGGDLSVAALAIGITVDQLRQELPGKSLAQVAQAHGKSANDVATALKNAANQRIDAAVAAGRLTADQAAQLKQRQATHIDQMVNTVKPAQGFGPRGGNRGPAPASTPGTAQ